MDISTSLLDSLGGDAAVDPIMAARQKARLAQLAAIAAQQDRDVAANDGMIAAVKSQGNRPLISGPTGVDPFSTAERGQIEATDNSDARRNEYRDATAGGQNLDFAGSWAWPHKMSGAEIPDVNSSLRELTADASQNPVQAESVDAAVRAAASATDHGRRNRYETSVVTDPGGMGVGLQGMLRPKAERDVIAAQQLVSGKFGDVKVPDGTGADGVLQMMMAQRHHDWQAKQDTGAATRQGNVVANAQQRAMERRAEMAGLPGPMAFDNSQRMMLLNQVMGPQGGGNPGGGGLIQQMAIANAIGGPAMAQAVAQAQTATGHNQALLERQRIANEGLISAANIKKQLPDVSKDPILAERMYRQMGLSGIDLAAAMAADHPSSRAVRSALNDEFEKGSHWYGNESRAQFVSKAVRSGIPSDVASGAWDEFSQVKSNATPHTNMPTDSRGMPTAIPMGY